MNWDGQLCPGLEDAKEAFMSSLLPKPQTPTFWCLSRARSVPEGSQIPEATLPSMGQGKTLPLGSMADGRT